MLSGYQMTKEVSKFMGLHFLHLLATVRLTSILGGVAYYTIADLKMYISPQILPEGYFQCSRPLQCATLLWPLEMPSGALQPC